MRWTLEVVGIIFIINLILVILSFLDYVSISLILSQLTGGMILVLIVFSIESLANLYKSLKN